MKQSSKRGITIGLFLLTVAPLSAMACSSPPSARPGVGVGDASAAIREDTDEIPCGPRLVLETTCQRCHALPPQNGAPFPLVRRSDMFATYTGAVVRDLMLQEVGAGRMPLSPVTITPESREVLLEWLRAGAPAVTPRSCADWTDAPDADADADAADASDAADSLDAGSQGDASAKTDGDTDDGDAAQPIVPAQPPPAP